MVDKFVDQDAKKERFSIQMESRKKSNHKNWQENELRDAKAC
jgi:hypothetical protein